MFTLIIWKQLNFHLNLLLTKLPKQKTEELGSVSKSEKVRLNRLYSRGRAAYGSIQNLSGLSETKIDVFLQTKTSYTNFASPVWRFSRTSNFFSKYIKKSGEWTQLLQTS